MQARTAVALIVLGLRAGPGAVTTDSRWKPMTVDNLRRVLVRDLRSVAAELNAYPDAARVWRLPPGVPNSGGTLALHITGNVRHFVGARLGGSGYVRDRAAEFAARDVPRAELLKCVEEAIRAVDSGLAVGGDDARLTTEFPDTVAGVRLSTELFLLHLVAHTAYHLGQLDYHRRLVTGDARGVGAVAVPALVAATA